MFRLADDDFVAWLEAWTGITLRHHINGFGGAPRPDNVFTAFGIKQLRDLIAGCFIARG
ncbi:hypothetical protein D3C76_1559940 [compost metagenome]